MNNQITDLRNHLFETLEALRDPKNPMDLDRAKTIGLVSGKIIESAKVEVEFMRVTGTDGSGFIPDSRPALPASDAKQPGTRPGVITHRLR